MTLHPMRGLVRVAAPAAEPLTLPETREFLRVANSDDDGRITDMIITARSLAEQWMRRSLVTQSWKLSREDAISGTVRLPMGPVQSITSVVVTPDGGSPQTVDGDAYALSIASDAMVVESLISGDRIDITYVTGYGTSAQIPKPIKLGLLQHVAAMMDGQVTLAPIPDAVLSLYMPFREILL